MLFRSLFSPLLPITPSPHHPTLRTPYSLTSYYSDTLELTTSGKICWLKLYVGGTCILPVINIHGRQHAHPTPIHAASHIKAFAKDIKPKRSLLHNTTGVASFSTVRPRFPVPLNLLAGLLPAKYAPRGNGKRVSSTGSSEIYPGESCAIREQKGVLTF